MRTYESDYSLAHYPVVGQLVKAASGALVASVLVACYVTAGPGNAYAYAMAQKQPGAQRIDLPAMEVVGSRTTHGQSVASLSCAKGA